MTISCINTTATPWPESATALRHLLGITLSPGLKCHALTKKHQACKQPISQMSALTVNTLLIEIAAKGSALLTKELLRRLAGLVMCRQSHQKLVEDLLRRWGETLPLGASGVESDSESDSESEDEPEDQKVVDGAGRENVVKETKKGFGYQETKVVVGNFPPAPQLSKVIYNDTKNIKSESPKRVRQIVRSPPVNTSDTSSNGSNKGTRTKTPTSDVPSDKHFFEPFGASKTTRQLNVDVKALIERQLLPKTELPAKGFIYVYTFPTRYRLRTPHLKIGFSKNVDQRMANWARQCGYEPYVMSTFTNELYVKIEKVIHAQLWNQRRRETPCPGCGVRHKEWFEVSETTVSHMISLWSGWSRQEPYDGQGRLTEEWRARLNKVDLDDKDCWSKFVEGK